LSAACYLGYFSVSGDTDISGLCRPDGHGKLDYTFNHFVYSSHPDAEGELSQTRLFRGRVASVIALEHLYHLEHHLYPAVPHHNWPELAKRLDSFFEETGVKPIKIWF
jgi:hypothetical protein